MSKVNVLFVFAHRDSVADTIIDDAVTFAEGGDWPVHVGVLMFNGILEALGSGVVVSEDVHKYDKCRTEMISVNVPDLPAASRKWRSLIGCKYSLLGSCFAGMIYDVFHRIIHKKWHWRYDCSETITLGLRKGMVKILPRVPAYCITPKDLFIALGGELNEKKIPNFCRTCPGGINCGSCGL